MDVKQAKQTARAWVESNRERWPGLVAAHLVGGITALPDGAPFPPAKDVDLHLVFAEGSPALTPTGAGPNILEESFGGLSLEAGVKSAAEYASPETVLGNPEIASHLAVDGVLFDPDGWLAALHEPVRRDFRRRRWVLARLDHERAGFAGALALRPPVAATWGASGEWSILGYSTTFLSAALSVAALEHPRMGSGMFVATGDLLAERGRADLHEDLLALLGVRDATPERVGEVIAEGAKAFDLAVAIAPAPDRFLPFGHKLHRHLRPYFVDACRGMVAAGRHREALAWAAPFAQASIDRILADGPEKARPRFAVRREALLREFGFDSAAARDARYAQAVVLGGRFFGLAEAMVAANPEVVD